MHNLIFTDNDLQDVWAATLVNLESSLSEER